MTDFSEMKILRVSESMINIIINTANDLSTTSSGMRVVVLYF